MRDGRPLVGLDTGRLLGVAVGVPGFVPASYTIALSKPGGGLAVQAGNLIAALDLILSGRDPRAPDVPAGPPPILLVKEAPFTLASFRDHAVSEAAVFSAFGLHTVVAGMCQRHGVPCRDAHVATVTKHFLGKGRWAGGRAARKNAIVRRCQVLGYFGLDCRDDDRADACAVWDWASVTLARVPPREIRLFGDRAA